MSDQFSGYLSTMAEKTAMPPDIITKELDAIPGMVYFGQCGYWTESISKTIKKDGLAVCPHCGGQIEAAPRAKWYAMAEEYAKLHRGFTLEIIKRREACMK